MVQYGDLRQPAQDQEIQDEIDFKKLPKGNIYCKKLTNHSNSENSQPH
jgi:hypothetical protein